MDINYLLFIQKARLALGSVFDQFFLLITELATPQTTFILLALVFWCIDKKTGTIMCWNVGLGCSLNTTVKRFFKIDRPWVRDVRIAPVEAALPGATDYSFPSGHTSRATATWGALASRLCLKKNNSEKRFLGALIWTLVMAVMFSRNYLGVHTPQDVLAAFAFGILLIFATTKLLDIADTKQGKYDLVIAISGMIICFVPMLRFGCMSNCGAGMGLFAGWYVERKWINFSIEGSVSRKALRFIVGVIPLLFILKAFSPLLSLFMDSKYAGFFMYGVLAFYIMAIYPFLFKKIESHLDAGKTKQAIKCTVASLIIFSLLIAVAGYGRNHMLRVAAIKADAERIASLQDEPTGMIGQTTYQIGPDGTLITEDNMGYQVIAKEDSWYYSDGYINTVDDNRAKMDVIGHRGYPVVAPENTLPSFKYAMELGADWIETDVQVTKDGKLVLFHDGDLQRITGKTGAISDYTYDELLQMDFGAWFSESYKGTQIPTLQEFLDLVKADDVKIYLELKDLGEVDGFVSSVYNVIEQNGMSDRVVYASFNYDYLKQFKQLDSSVPILLNTAVGNTSILEETPAEYYGINAENAKPALINAIHAAGSKAFIFTPNTAQQIQNLYRMGADGVCTNQVGVAMAASHPEHEFVADNALWSHAMPGLYDSNLPEQCSDMIYQGFTKTTSNLITAAYSGSGQYNSVLYIMDLEANLQQVVDLGHKAHMGGIAYDENHDILWTTGVEGMVYALSMTDVLSGSYSGQMVTQFDAGLYNTAGGHVASFVSMDNGFLYVGSYCNEGNGLLNKYDISDINNPRLISQVPIPDRIQGVTFVEKADGSKKLLMTRGHDMYEGFLLQFTYADDAAEFLTPEVTYHLPEGPEQILWTSKGLYLQLESASLPYRATARNACDQLWILQLPK